MTRRRVLTAGALLLAATLAGCADEAQLRAASPYAQWKNGPSTDPSYFPIAV